MSARTFSVGVIGALASGAITAARLSPMHAFALLLKLCLVKCDLRSIEIENYRAGFRSSQIFCIHAVFYIYFGGADEGLYGYFLWIDG